MQPERQPERADAFDRIETANLTYQSANSKKYEEVERGLKVPDVDLGLFLRNAPGKRMLDLGCGWGRYVHRFIEAGMEYLGIDASPEVLEIARKRNPDQRFRLMSFHDLDIEFEEDESFDAMWACCCFNGTPKTRMPEVLAEVRRLLVPGGIVSILLPLNFESWEGFGTHEATGLPLYFAEWHLEELKQAVADAGLKVIYGIQRFQEGGMAVIGKKI